MKLVLQKNFVDCCMHACVAMLADVSLQEVIDYVRTTDRLGSFAAYSALRHFGVSCDDSTLMIGFAKPIMPKERA